MIERNPLMFTGEGDFERGRREANEGRERIARRARIEAEEASAARTRLERGSPSAGRRNFAGMLNALAKGHTEREAPGLDALDNIRRMQRHGYRTAAQHNAAHARFEKAIGGDFDRLHPASDLRRDDIASGEDAKARYDPSGDLSGIEPEFLLDVARALIAAARAQAARFPANRRD